MTKFLEMAQKAIQEVKNCKIQSANTWGAVITDTLGITDHGKPVSVVQAKREPLSYDDLTPVFTNASLIKSAKAGNCDEKTIVALDFLTKKYKDEARFTLCSSVGYDHAFLIIHENGQAIKGPGDLHSRSDFGESAVLVDAWQHDYYKLNGKPTITFTSWMLGPQQVRTRWYIASHGINVRLTAESV